MPNLPKTVFYTALMLALVTAAASIAQLNWLYLFGPNSVPNILLSSLAVMGIMLPSLMPFRWRPLAKIIALPAVVILVESVLSPPGYGILAVWLSLPISYLLLFTFGLPFVWKVLRGAFVSWLFACIIGILCTAPAIVLQFLSFPAQTGKDNAYFLLWTAIGAFISVALFWRKHSTIRPDS
jgi:hypothetical protein